jgi:DnaK suppressor protein
MEQDDKTELRRRIDEELTACRRDIVRLEESARPVAPDKALGRLTRMESLNDQGISNAALSQKRERLYQLEKALEHIDRPGFGRCAVCGRAIPWERLMALPESTRCVTCAGR